MEINTSLKSLSALLIDKQKPFESGNNGKPGRRISSKHKIKH